MANLPSNTFMFNYNARDYIPGTHTIPKTQGQLFDEDLVLDNSPAGVYEDRLSLNNSVMLVNYGTGQDASNPLNRSASNSSFTFIYKTSGFTSGSQNLLGNRSGGAYNYMVRGNMFHTSQSGFLGLTPNTYPEICLIRIYADGRSERKFLDSSGNVLQSTSSATITWGSLSNSFGLFSGYGTQRAEIFSGIFYWMYCSLETLTDQEVLKVIQYNENTGPLFEVSPTALTVEYFGGLNGITVTTEEDMAWTAATPNNWITLSMTGGTGSATFIANISENKAYEARTGVITLYNGETTLTVPVTQSKHPLLVPKNNIYREGLIIN